MRLSLELADSRIADWAAERVLLVGTGAYAAVTLATLRERGAVDISVHSPSGRAELFEWAVGVAVTANGRSRPRPSPGAVLDLRRVDGSVEVRIGDETLCAVVTAGH